MTNIQTTFPLKRDGHFVIQGRKYYPEELKEKLSSGEKITMAEHQCFMQKILERKAEIEGLPIEAVSGETTDEIISNSPPFLDMPTEEAKEEPKKKKKKSKKHKDKKRKKRAKRAKEAVKASLKERPERSSNLMAQHLYNKREMVLCDNQIFDYKDSIGCFNPSSEEEISRMAMSFLDEDEWLKVSFREATEIHQLLRISNAIKEIDGFFANAPYVNCLNGVVEVCKQTLLPHSPKYFFRHCIQSNFNPDTKCKKFLAYLDYITGGNKKLIQQWRISLGYVFSHYHNAKSALLLYGIPHTGKSVMCKLIEGVIGKDYTTHIDLADMHKQEYVAKLSGAIVNIAPDLKDEPIKDAGFFKSLVSSNDTITARALYNNPIEIKGETKMVFASNHFISFAPSLSEYDIEAVFNRLQFIPYQNPPITGDIDNKHLAEELLEERDGIFTWAMSGLKEYVESNETLYVSPLSQETKNQNMIQYCPEKIFFDECIKPCKDAYESSKAIKEAFKEYCYKYDVHGSYNIDKFLEVHARLQKSKKRIDADGNSVSTGNPIAVYEGIRLRNKYRV